MLFTFLQLHCDGRLKNGHRCRQTFPAKRGTLDGALYTHADVRRMAKSQAGWIRFNNSDFCAKCKKDPLKMAPF